MEGPASAMDMFQHPANPTVTREMSQDPAHSATAGETPQHLRPSNVVREAHQHPKILLATYDTVPFEGTQRFHEIEDGGSSWLLEPHIYGRIEKGFFVDDYGPTGAWTCYRRNYFAVRCGYSFIPRAGGALFLRHRDKDATQVVRKQIQAISMVLSAEVHGVGGKRIELVQHTPKRDKGPRLPMQPVYLWPQYNSSDTGFIWPLLPLQEDVVNSDLDVLVNSNPERQEGRMTSHVFERVQFPAATANNGKRRAQQQFYHLNVELLVDIRPNADDSPCWIKVAQRCSPGLVVRGRSPSHYQGSISDPHNSRALKRVTAPLATVADTEIHSRPNYEEPPHPPDNDADAQEVLDDSSVSSTQSRLGGSSLPISRTSITSMYERPDITEQLVKLIIESEGVNDLLVNCFTLDRSNRVERNLRRLLRIFAKQLRTEGSQQVEIAVARALKHHSRKISSALNEHSLRKSAPKPGLPLHQVPNSSDYVMDQFMAEGTIKPSGVGSMSQPYSSINPPFEMPSDRYKASVTNASLSEIDDYSSSSNGSVSGSEKDILELHDHAQYPNFARGRDFLRNSEALEDFKENLLDLRVGLENALHNRITQEQVYADLHEIPEYHQMLSGLRQVWKKAMHKTRRAFRPPIKRGKRRVEWICECGQELFADFPKEDSPAVDELQAALRQNAALDSTAMEATSSGEEYAPDTNASALEKPSNNSQNQHSAARSGKPNLSTASTLVNTMPTLPSSSPRYLAICGSTSGRYKVLSELDLSQIKSDAELFSSIKRTYLTLRKSQRFWSSYLKPVNVEFIQLCVWEMREGYISISDGPRCVPPKDDSDYDFVPRPLAPLPPVPPEIFVHYLEHKNDPVSDIHRLVWTSRLPKRKAKRLIDCDIGTYGWGIYIKEGPNRTFVFCMVVLSVLCSVLISVIWAGLKGDVQGATGLGTLVLGVHSVIMAAFMFKFGELV